MNTVNRTAIRPVSTRWLVLLLWCLIPLVATAEEPWCGRYAYDSDHPLSWQNLAPGYADKGGGKAGYRYITSVFDADYGGPHWDAEEVVTFHKAFGKYLNDIDDPEIRDEPERWKSGLIRDEDRGEILQYALPVSDEANAFPAEVIVPCAAFEQDGESYLVALAYTFHALNTAGLTDQANLRESGAEIASKRYNAYRDMLYNGLAMWPWELWANGFLVKDNFDAPPPKTQLVLMRPNVGMALKFDGLDGSQLDFAFAVEPVGFVRYTDSSYRKWWGASPLLTITNDNGIGLGALARYRTFTAGATWHEQDSDVLLYLSVDLYQYLLGEKGKLRMADEFLDKHRDRLVP